MAKKVKTPWYGFYDGVKEHLNYPNVSVYKLLETTANKHLDYISYNYFGNKKTYADFLEQIDECARALKAMGVKKGDKISICMPNTPEAITMFYAVNMIGAISNMIHPLSSEKEIEMFLNKTKSKVILTIDINYKKVINIINNTYVTKVIVSSAGDDLKGFKKFMYNIFNADVTKAVKKIKQVL